MTAPAPSPFDPGSVDLDAFFLDVKALKEEIASSLGPGDYAHLKSVERRGRIATAIGLATAWIAPNPLSALTLALGRSTRWLLMHHISHRGYDRVPGVPRHRTSKGFAMGWRRFLDWADWMIPEAWAYEHNVLHHSHTGEETDPDVIERHAEALSSAAPWYRWLILIGLGVSWRSAYYAPSTLDVWRKQREALARDGRPLPSRTLELWLKCYVPYVLIHFVLLPVAFLIIGPWAAFSALCNSLMAEVLTNLHTFLMVGPNHTGEDLYRFDEAPKTRGERYLFQVIGSVNYATGDEVTDYAHLWLNYQIEHHLFPDIPMLKYREIQPRVRELCAKHGIPYVQESVWTRVRKMAEVILGRRKMRRLSLSSAAEAKAA